MCIQAKTTADRVIVIGGGASGLMAALQSARAGADTVLLEKNEKTGKKIYITGKGRCNVTNAEEDTTLFLRKVMRNPRFMYASVSAFGPFDMMALLEALGCPVKTERGKRVFPQSDHASDVTQALERGVRNAGGQILLHREVEQIMLSQNTVQGVQLTDGTVLRADRVIVCTGGLSYPSTGSTGDGYRFAGQAGHAVSTTYPSLTGLETEEKWPSALEGLSLKNVMLKGFLGKKQIFEEQGEMLFTHYGISGPLVLELSAVLSGQDLKSACVSIDMKPALSLEQLDMRMCRELRENGKKQLSSLLKGYLPIRMAALFPDMTGVDGMLQCAAVTARQRKTLCEGMKNIPLTVTSLRSFSEAVITRGGVDVKQINPTTMESKLVKGLYFAGEVLDLDAMTGGFNLQIAFSTGYAAGRSAALSLEPK